MLNPIRSMQFTTFVAFALAIVHVGVATTGASVLEARQVQTCTGVVEGICGPTSCVGGGNCIQITVLPPLGVCTTDR